MTERSGVRERAEGVRRIPFEWTLLVFAWAVLVTAADALLIERTQTFFTAGFNAGHARGIPQLAAFFATSALVDFWLLSAICLLAFPLSGRVPGTDGQRLVAVWLVALAVPFSIDFVRYRLGLVLGDMADLPVLLDVAAGSFGMTLAEGAAQASPLLIVLAISSLASFGVVLAVGRAQRARGFLARARRPSLGALVRAFALLSLLASAASLVTASAAPNLYAGIREKPSGWLLDHVIQRVTDVDFDGFGALSHPSDPAPFDGSRHPYALDLAGNGIDENGFAGDLPRGTRAADVVPLPPRGEPERRPDLLVIYLEGFRADLLGRLRAGRPITPFLNELAAAGSASGSAYVHSPYTLWSRAQLFGGVLIPERGQRTLVDDFAERGYTVALFSGQDDSFGGSAALMGRDRAHFTYDAREDVERRTTRSASAVSLQVSAKLVLERVRAFLSEYGGERPLFLYVNLVDTHFPYTHDEIDDLLGAPPLSWNEIRPENAERVRAAYENTAANVDLAVRELVADFRRWIGDRDHAILVTSDHGQGFYERGFLGHGQALTDDQTRVPFILWGVGGEWPEPLGMADVRGLLQQHLFRASADGADVARFVPDPSRRVLHYMARIERPRMIGLRSTEGLTIYDLGRDSLALFDPDDRPRELPDATRTAAFEELVHTWEASRAVSLRPQ